MYATLVIMNGPIITIDDEDRIVDAVACVGNTIRYVGSMEDVKGYIGPDTRVIDLKGRAMTPGFIDCHMHPILAGFFGGAIIDVTYPKCTSNKQMLEIIAERARTTPKGQWIKVWGYDQNKYEEGEHPTIDMLDAAAPEHPVQCMRICGHLGVYNRMALHLGGIDGPEDAKKFPANQVVVKDGKLTGMAKDNTNFFLWSLIRYTEDEKWDALMRSHERLLKTGITSIHIPGEVSDPGYPMVRQAIRDRKFLVRCYGMNGRMTDEKLEEFIQKGEVTGAGDEHFRYGAFKFMLDGGTSGPSCATRKPYTHDPSLPGILNWNQDYVDNMLDLINRNHLQGTAHSVGDKAVEMMLNGYEKALASCPRKDPRHRIEHCALTDEDLIARMKKLNIIPVSNTHFLVINGSDYKKYYGDRVNYMFALRSYLDAGLRPVIGCDAPTGDVEVMVGLDGAINRVSRNTGEVIGEQQRVTLMEALRCFTINGAYASFEENRKGSIEVGKLADFAVLSEDILNYPIDNIRDIWIDYTIIDGEIVYSREREEAEQ